MRRIWIPVFIVAIVLVGACTRSDRETTVVHGDSMAPRIASGQQVTYTKGRRPNRFDIVVYRYDSQTVAVGRAIGLPGEEIQVNGPELRVNGVKVDDPYAATPANYIRDFALTPFEYVVLQDQRSTGGDSHSRGPVAEKDIIGSAPPE